MDYLGILDGLILSDGCLDISNRNPEAVPRYTQSCKHEEYLLFVKQVIANFEVSFPDKCIDYYNYGSPWYRFRTRNDCVFFREQYHRWYKDQVKIVPRDLVLSPECVKHWFIGDGFLSQTGGYLKGVGLSTDCFEEDDQYFLCDLLKDIDLSCRYERKKKNLFINKSSVSRFFEYIGNCPVTCYEYKWDIASLSNPPRKYGSADHRKEIWQRCRRKKKQTMKSTISSQASEN